MPERPSPWPRLWSVPLSQAPLRRWLNLKRTRLERRTTLQGAGQLERSPLAPISRKRAKKRRAREECVEIVLARTGGRCEAEWHLAAAQREGGAIDMRHWPECSRGTPDVHEVLPRSRGGDPTDPADCVCLCRNHHRWVDDRPRDARAIGLLRSGYRLAKVLPIH